MARVICFLEELMMYIQDVEYTDFMYWQDSETFKNGVASSTGYVELLFDEKVDRDTSLVIYDGKQIDLNQEHTYIDIQKEGITQLVYILKDVDGYSLEEGEKTILLDTTVPDVIFSCKGQKIQDVLPLEKEEQVHVKIVEENVEEVEVYLDEKKIEPEDLEFDIDVNVENRVLKVLCKDVAGHVLTKEIPIKSIEYPKCSLTSVVYTKDSAYDLCFDSICTQPYYLHVYCDGLYYYTLNLEDTNHIRVDLAKNGKYTFVLENKEFSQFKKDLEATIVYSNIQPVISLRPSNTYGRDDVFVNILSNVSCLESGYYEIESNGNTNRYSLQENFVLKALENQDILYKIQVYVQDIFGHTAKDTLNVQIDRKAPSSTLYIDDVIYQESMPLKKLPYIRYVLDDTNANVQMEYYLNGNRMDMEFEKIFNRMVKDDVLKIVTYARDSLQNLEMKEYEFVFSPEQKLEMISKSVQTMANEEVVEFERVWQVNEENELVLKKNSKKTKQTAKPVIHYVRSNNKIRMWTKKQFEYVRINGKNAKTYKDVLGHDAIEFELKRKETKVEAKIKNADREYLTFKREKVKKQKVQMNWFQKVVRFFKKIFRR